MPTLKHQVPKGMQDWPQQAIDLTTEQVIDLYERGMAGAKYDFQAREALFASVDYPDGEQAAYDFGLAGTGEGKLSMPFLYAWTHWPKCWPCPGQTTGDCVGHGGKNAAIVNIGVEVAMGQPDPVSGRVEGWPEVSAEAEQQGVVACEPQYGARGHSGQGANCDVLIKWMISKGGIFLRQPYPELGIDLTKYNASIGIRWGGSGVPANVCAEGAKHQFRTATNCQTHEVVRDFQANGYAMWACSGLGWASQRDEWGFSKQSGSWSHSWIIMAYDDRPEIKEKYGCPLALYNHDWSVWNSGGRDIYKSAEFVPAHLKQEWIAKGIVNALTGNIMIPEGSFWMDARLLNRCDNTAMSNINGWPARKLPDWGAGGFG